MLIPVNLITLTSQPMPNRVPTEIDDSNLKNAKEAGSYPVIFTYVDENNYTYKETVYITITYQHTIINEIFNEAIDAYDIEIAEHYFMQLTDSDLIQLAKARAWITQTGETLPIERVERQTLDASNGMYRVTFFTKRGTSTTITVIEKAEPIAIGYKNYYNVSQIGVSPLIIVTVLTLILVGIGIIAYNYYRSTRKIREVNKLLYEVRKRDEGI